MIPILDIKAQHQALATEIETAVLDVLRSGHYVLGPNVTAFEEEAAKHLGVKHSIGCANGSDALYLALLALGVKAGDEVITTPFTYIATAEAIDQIGAKPVFADINAETFNIDPNEISKKITEKTKAIIVVHLYGQCCDMEAIMKIAADNNLKVIEDAAQAFGASMTYHGEKRMAGSIGDIGTFSFYPTKNLSCAGDGGLMTTQSDQLNEYLRKIRVHGTYKRYHHDALGVNSRLDEIQAAILRIKLRHIADWNAHRQKIAAIYDEAILQIPSLAAPAVADYSKGGHIYHQYTVLVDGIGSPAARNDSAADGIASPEACNDGGDLRDQLREKLNEQGLSTELYYPVPLHMQPVYKDLGYKPEDFPKAMHAAANIFCLPVYAELSLEQAKEVAEALLAALKEPALK